VINEIIKTKNYAFSATSLNKPCALAEDVAPKEDIKLCIFLPCGEYKSIIAFSATSLNKPCVLAEDVAPKKGFKLCIFLPCGECNRIIKTKNL
jgi:hypothetical protein